MKIRSAINKAAVQFGTKIVRKLGGGAGGQAFLLANGMVAKFTVDKSEANNCQKVLGKETKYLANIFSVFEIEAKEWIENVNNSGEYWLILLEFLKTKKVNGKVHSSIPFNLIEDELMTFGIDDTDFHIANFGFREDRIIHFDFGKCEYPEDAKFNLIYV